MADARHHHERCSCGACVSIDAAALRSSVEGAVVVMGEFAAAFQRARTALDVEEGGRQ